MANVGIFDRLLRLLLSSVLFYFGLFIFADSALGTGVAIAACIPLFTSLVGFCPLYRLLGIRTCPLKKAS